MLGGENIKGKINVTYVYLFMAIVAEVIATSALKASNSFTNIGPSILVIVGYGVAIYLLTLVINYMSVGVAYAIWSGLGVTLVTVIAAIIYKQIPDMPALIGIGLIISGVVIINIFSKTVSH
jgi:small multidrug resistance pump